MGCVCNNVPSDVYLSCARVAPIFTEAQVAQYANRVGAQGGSGNWVYCYVIACLRAARILYFKVSPGDCGGSTRASYQPSTDTTIATSLGAISASDPEPISNSIISIASQVFGLFGAQHQQAVATEENVLCQASIDYGSFASAAEVAIQSGQIDVVDAYTTLNQVVQSIEARIAGIEKPIDTPNAATGVHKALDALYLLNKELLYPSLAPIAPGLTSTLSAIPGVPTLQQAIAAVPGVSSVPGGSSTVLLILLALLGWKLLSGGRPAAAS